ncbi:MAG: GNAT family N-acetyltransferase [Candidatus Hermodarchaeota archaeon]
MDTNPPHIRPMRNKDWIHLNKLDVEIFPEDSLTENEFQRMVDSQRMFALESESNQLIGYLYVAPFGDDTGIIGRIGVTKTQQKKGLGSQLMQYAINWFREQGGIRKVILRTQDFNIAAQKLYIKFGFRTVGTTWHYFVPFNTIKPQGRYTCHKITPEEIDTISTLYPETMPASQIRKWLENDLFVFTLKTTTEKIIGACRFRPDFPGASSFNLEVVAAFDDFIEGIRAFSLPAFDYVRITFTDNLELAKLMEHRKYKLHHRLHEMELNLTKKE